MSALNLIFEFSWRSSRRAIVPNGCRKMPGEGDGDNDQLTPGQIWDLRPGPATDFRTPDGISHIHTGLIGLIRKTVCCPTANPQAINEITVYRIRSSSACVNTKLMPGRTLCLPDNPTTFPLQSRPGTSTLAAIYVNPYSFDTTTLPLQGQLANDD